MAPNRFRSLLLIIALPQVIAAPSFLAGRDTSTIADQFLTAQNTVRAEYGAVNMTWNSTLADFATQWASKCEIAFSGGPYEIASTSPGNYSPQAMVKFWVDGQDRSYFTQLIWNSSTEVGCAIVPCAHIANASQINLYFCEYYPPGNVDGEYSQNVPLSGVSHIFVGG